MFLNRCRCGSTSLGTVPLIHPAPAFGSCRGPVAAPLSPLPALRLARSVPRPLYPAANFGQRHSQTGPLMPRHPPHLSANRSTAQGPCRQSLSATGEAGASNLPPRRVPCWLLAVGDTNLAFSTPSHPLPDWLPPISHHRTSPRSRPWRDPTFLTSIPIYFNPPIALGLVDRLGDLRNPGDKPVFYPSIMT